jgi:predicted glycosyltransferase
MNMPRRRHWCGRAGKLFPMSSTQTNCTASPRERIRKYTGIKEEVYAPEFKPDPSLRGTLQLDQDKIIVTVRPPATEAHYHNPQSDEFFARFMDRAAAAPGVKTVLLPRNKAQAAQIRASSPQWFKDGRVVIPAEAVDGLNLLWHSDLVVSGGGTMNREAAALGVPVYSIFRGKSGAVDRHLQSQGKMILIETPEDVDSKILLKFRKRNGQAGSGPCTALREIVEHVDEIVRFECGSSKA